LVEVHAFGFGGGFEVWGELGGGESVRWGVEETMVDVSLRNSGWSCGR
jgi:hypothetical protein